MAEAEVDEDTAEDLTSAGGIFAEQQSLLQMGGLSERHQGNAWAAINNNNVHREEQQLPFARGTKGKGKGKPETIKQELVEGAGAATAGKGEGGGVLQPESPIAKAQNLLKAMEKKTSESRKYALAIESHGLSDTMPANFRQFADSMDSATAKLESLVCASCNDKAQYMDTINQVNQWFSWYKTQEMVAKTHMTGIAKRRRTAMQASADGAVDVL